MAGLAVAATLAGCGSTGAGSAGSSSDGGSSSSASPSASAPASPSATASTLDCPADTRGPSAQVDVDGDGRPEQVHLVSSSCGPGVVASRGSRTWSVRTDAQEPPVQEVYGVRVPGRASQLVVTRSSHPRGGVQLRVYAGQGDRLVELRRGTEPLVPFTATDVQEQPASIACGQDSLVLTVAVAHEPPGVVAAWDVRRTAYTLDPEGGATLQAGPTREVADNVLPAKLRTQWPDLVQHRAFAGCRVG